MDWMYKIASEYGFCCGSDMFVFQLIMSKEQSSVFPVLYSGAPLNEHPWKADTHDVTDNSESPNCPSIHFNT